MPLDFENAPGMDVLGGGGVGGGGAGRGFSGLEARQRRVNRGGAAADRDLRGGRGAGGGGERYVHSGVKQVATAEDGEREDGEREDGEREDGEHNEGGSPDRQSLDQGVHVGAVALVQGREAGGGSERGQEGRRRGGGEDWGEDEDVRSDGGVYGGGGYRRPYLVEVILDRTPLSTVTGERANMPLFGVGLGLDPCPWGGLVQVLTPGSAAAQSGMFDIGDVVVTVGDCRISAWSADQLRAAFLGPFGSSVSVGLLKASQVKRTVLHTLTRSLDMDPPPLLHVHLTRGEGAFSRLSAPPPDRESIFSSGSGSRDHKQSTHAAQANIPPPPVPSASPPARGVWWGREVGRVWGWGAGGLDPWGQRRDTETEMDRGTVVEAEEENKTSSQADGSCLREDDGARDRGGGKGYCHASVCDERSRSCIAACAVEEAACEGGGGADVPKEGRGVQGIMHNTEKNVCGTGGGGGGEVGGAQDEQREGVVASASKCGVCDEKDDQKDDVSLPPTFFWCGGRTSKSVGCVMTPQRVISLFFSPLFPPFTSPLHVKVWGV
jgi:hypothetical protein